MLSLSLPPSLFFTRRGRVDNCGRVGINEGVVGLPKASLSRRRRSSTGITTRPIDEGVLASTKASLSRAQGTLFDGHHNCGRVGIHADVLGLSQASLCLSLSHAGEGVRRASQPGQVASQPPSAQQGPSATGAIPVGLACFLELPSCRFGNSRCTGKFGTVRLKKVLRS